MKHRLTIQQHKDIAKVLLESICHIGYVHLRASLTYGKRSRASTAANSAYSGLQKLRSRLDDDICAENPRDDSVLGIYYPDRQAENEQT